MGKLRQNFALSSAQYGPLLTSATWRHGYTATTTGEIHAEAVHDGPRAVGVDLAQALEHWAVVTADFAVGGESATSGLGGSAQRATSGAYAALGIQHVDGRLSIVLQAQHASSGFREVGDLSGVPPPLERGIAQAGWGMGRAGNLQAVLVAQRNYDDTRQQAIALTYQASVGRGNMSATVSRTTGDTHETSVFISMQCRWISATIRLPQCTTTHSSPRQTPLWCRRCKKTCRWVRATATNSPWVPMAVMTPSTFDRARRLRWMRRQPVTWP